MSMKILGLILLLAFNTSKAEIVRLPIEFGQTKALIFDTNIKKDEMGTQINSLGGSFSSARGHRANATINLLKSDGIINYVHKYSKGTVTFDSNIISTATEPQMNSIGSSFTSVNGYRASAAINLIKGYGLINYTHKNSKGTITFDTNISNERTTPQITSFGGGFSGLSGHGMSAVVNTTGSGGAINYTHTNNKMKFKFSSGVNVNNDIRAINIGFQLPLGIK
ncbi:MAG: hypothetical protein U1D41_12945 [Nitrosomonas sp.]|uniref:hypothetical protein n=1 Tax=Nitrosomonas sp. TaxID=42353 RepID=UPI0027360439|nr:hypothetical protein [Nitrosomonas sp.]MDP3663745.1 hypothetical protein [Nitrosomonas sp.]MDZ4107036.1 hypothetical protein [Nitrosomonas sp.]